MTFEPRFCLNCGTGLALQTAEEDGGPKERLRCPGCGWTHWNNPVPVLANKLMQPQDIRCWRAGTGYALADWLRLRGHEPQFIDLPPRA